MYLFMYVYVVCLLLMESRRRHPSFWAWRQIALLGAFLVSVRVQCVPGRQQPDFLHTAFGCINELTPTTTGDQP